MSKRYVTSAREWVGLPELPMRTLSHHGETGTVYWVLRTGFYRARRAEVREAAIDSGPGEGMLPLPTVTVEENNEPRLYRLPLELDGWAYDNVGLAPSGARLFPSEVEFGVLDGRAYAEFVVTAPADLN